MRKQRAITAEELLMELSKDPAWVAKQAEDQRNRDRLSEEFSTLEQPILLDLRAHGVDVGTIGNAKAFTRYLPLAKEIVTLFLRWLPNVHYRLKEPIVRLLGVPLQPYDGTSLANLFDNTLKLDLDQTALTEAIAISGLRWAIGNTIAEAQPYGITEWVLNKVKDQTLGKSKEMLLVAVARLVPRDQAILVLIANFDQFPDFCAQGLSEIGRAEEREFLRKRRHSLPRGIRDEIDIAIEIINERIGR